MMTRAQVKKLDALCGRTEMLQLEVAASDRDAAHAIGEAKTKLLDLLRRVERK